MKRLRLFLIAALFAAMPAAGVKYVAVVETEVDMPPDATTLPNPTEVRLVTEELRREAVKNLPPDKYSIMTTETVLAQGTAVLLECAEENCVIALGSKIGADYIVRGTIRKSQTRFTLSVNIFETEDGNLVASSEAVRSENIEDLIEKAAAVCAGMYRDFVKRQFQAAPVPVPEPAPTQMPSPISASEPKASPAKPKEKPKAAKPKPAKVAKPARVADVSVEDTATGGGRHLCSMYSGAVNPALVNEEKYKSARFLYFSTLESFYSQEAGFNMPLGLRDAAGVAWIMNSASPFEATDSDGVPMGQRVLNQNHFIALTYARNVWKELTVGGNINIIAQNVADIPSEDQVGNAVRFGFGADIGLTYKILRHQVYGNHTVGFSTNNIINVIMDTDEKYPAALRFSLLSDFWWIRILPVFYGVDFVLKDVLAPSGEFVPGATPTMPWEFNLTVGGSILRVVNLCWLIGFNNEFLDHYGFALGVNAGRFFGGHDIEAMIQYVSIRTSTAEANASRVTFCVRTEFGKLRKESYAGD
jgi:hypothetical protein